MVLPDELILEISHYLDGLQTSCDACYLYFKRWLKLEKLNRHKLCIRASDIPGPFVKLRVQRFVKIINDQINERWEQGKGGAGLPITNEIMSAVQSSILVLQCQPVPLYPAITLSVDDGADREREDWIE
ncbi:hypothetical protein NE237_006379 [Protea cynaroides]|uniref:Uncharacterized protein n=1 Tax=Protea cynaroides TaxID=273540 RepID=A0A9Q0KMH6_9MAGN|nr:hypothetical protein NE237_006379 [Protea cynaroides]